VALAAGSRRFSVSNQEYPNSETFSCRLQIPSGRKAVRVRVLPPASDLVGSGRAQPEQVLIEAGGDDPTSLPRRGVGGFPVRPASRAGARGLGVA
jgi:hypothetical protein